MGLGGIINFFIDFSVNILEIFNFLSTPIGQLEFDNQFLDSVFDFLSGLNLFGLDFSSFTLLGTFTASFIILVILVRLFKIFIF